jgi:hypothetical protein
MLAPESSTYERMVEPALPIMPPHTADGTTSFTIFLFANSSLSVAVASVPAGRHVCLSVAPSAHPPSQCLCMRRCRRSSA